MKKYLLLWMIACGASIMSSDHGKIDRSQGFLSKFQQEVVYAKIIERNSNIRVASYCEKFILGWFYMYHYPCCYHCQYSDRECQEFNAIKKE